MHTILIFGAAFIGVFVFGYFVGANNPFNSVKAKIIQAAKDKAAKL